MRDSDHCRRGHRAILALVLASAVMAPLPGALAQQADGASQALARAQGLLRQLAQQKAQVEGELAKLRAENAKLQKDGKRSEALLEERSAELESSARETAGVKAKLGSTEKRLERTTAQLKDVVVKYKERARLQRETEAEREDLRGRLEVATRELADAERKNLELYKLNKSLVAEFEKEGPWDGFRRKEPLLGFKQVEVENIAQEYEDKLREELRPANVEQAAEPLDEEPRSKQ
jgi:septal ring factor EnvC (AmiA/AmiB activator)